MRHPVLFLALAGATLLAGHAHADMIVRLKNGLELRAPHTWTEGGLVKFEHRGGVVGFSPDAIESIEEEPKAADAAMVRTSSPPEAAPGQAGPAAAVPATEGGRAAAGGQGGDAKPPKQAASAAAAIETKVPEVKGEDLETRMERLDGLSLRTHRELSVARSRGDSQAVLDALQARLDEINRQRTATGKSLGTIH